MGQVNKSGKLAMPRRVIWRNTHYALKPLDERYSLVSTLRPSDRRLGEKRSNPPGRDDSPSDVPAKLETEWARVEDENREYSTQILR